MEFEASSDSSEEFIPQRIEVQADIENVHTSSIKETSINTTYDEFIRKSQDSQFSSTLNEPSTSGAVNTKMQIQSTMVQTPTPAGAPMKQILFSKTIHKVIPENVKRLTVIDENKTINDPNRNLGKRKLPYQNRVGKPEDNIEKKKIVAHEVDNVKETKNVKYGSELQKYMKEIVTAHDQLAKKTSSKRLNDTDQLLKYLRKCDSLTKKIQKLKDLLSN